MLVLQRRIDEAIKIGDDIEVVVLSVSGDHVKLGIQAPRHIRVLRSELVDDVQAENRRAATAASATLPAQITGLLGGTPFPAGDEPTLPPPPSPW